MWHRDALTNVDGWNNVLTGLGVASRDKRLAAAFCADAPMAPEVLESLYHGNDVVARICEKPAKEATREWIEIPADDDKRITKKLRKLNAQKKIREAETWARLYGDSIIVMIVDDGKELTEPLDVNTVKDITDLMVLDRSDLWIASYYTDPSLPNFGEPEHYAVRTSTILAPAQTATSGASLQFGARIHESRCLRFQGTLTGRRKKRDNQGWNLSVMDRVYDVVRDFCAAYGGAAHLLQDYGQAVFKMKNLANNLAKDADQIILRRLQLLDMARSVARAIPLDADSEDFKREATPTTGLDDLLDKMSERLSMATDMPITLLVGTSAKGLNATGEGDLTNWYNEVRSHQETDLRPPVNTLIRIVAVVTGFSNKTNKDDDTSNDEDAEEIEWVWRPLWQPTEKELAETRNKVAMTDVAYHQIGVLDSHEIAVSRFGGEKYSMETTIDLKQHDQNLPDPLDPDAETEATQPTKATGTTSKNAAAGTPDVQKTALNGAQLTAGGELLKGIGDGSLDPAATAIFIKLSFPDFDPAQVDTMVNLQKKGAKPPEPAPAPVIAGAPPKPKPAAGEE